MKTSAITTHKLRHATAIIDTFEYPDAGAPGYRYLGFSSVSCDEHDDDVAAVAERTGENPDEIMAKATADGLIETVTLPSGEAVTERGYDHHATVFYFLHESLEERFALWLRYYTPN